MKRMILIVALSALLLIAGCSAGASSNPYLDAKQPYPSAPQQTQPQLNNQQIVGNGCAL